MILPLITLHASRLTKVSSVLLTLAREAEGGHIVPSSLVILGNIILFVSSPRVKVFSSDLLLDEFLKIFSKKEVLSSFLALPQSPSLPSRPRCLPPVSDDPLHPGDRGRGGGCQTEPQCQCQHHLSHLISKSEN